MDLLDVMGEALSLAPDAETLDSEELKTRCEHSATRRRAVTRMMNLIIECGYFIQTYTNDVNFGINLSWLHHVMIC